MASVTEAGNEDERSEIIECFSLFQTNLLNDEWLNDVWKSNEFEIESIPSDYEEIHNDTNWSSVLRDATNSIRNQTASTTVNDESIIPLLDKSGHLKGVIVLTCYFIERGLKTGAGRGSHKSSITFIDREVSILAASLYLCIVGLPGSNAFRLFHPFMYEKTLLLFEGIDTVFLDSVSSRSVVSGRRGGPGRRPSSDSTSQKRKMNEHRKKPVAKKSRTTDKSAESDSDELQEDVTDEEADFDNSETCTLTRREAQSLLDLFYSLLSDIALFLSNYSLKSSVHSVESTTRHLSELLAFESSKNNTHDIDRLLSKCFVVFRKLCDPVHGSVDSLTCVVVKYLMPVILAGHSKLVPNFIMNLAEDVPNGGALLAIRTLVQHLCFKVHEKAEARSKLANVVVSILDKLPHVAYAAMLEWLLRFSQTAKVLHRLFVLELFSLILGHSTRRNVDIVSVPADLKVYLSDVCLLKSVFDRCSDKAAGVRTKALAIVASSAICAEPHLHSIMLKILTPACNTPTIGVSRPSSQSVTDENHDSSTCIATEQANNDSMRLMDSEIEMEMTLPDYDFVIRLVTLRVMDTKVQVRRTALQLLQVIVELSADSITVANVNILREHCLDVSLLVRKQSLHSLTHLIQSFPQNDTLHEAWLGGVLQSIVDCESTCQTKCVEAVEEVIIQNIVPYHKSVEVFHKMAWAILNKVAISQSKEQWRYLRRSLVVLSQTGKIKPNLMVAIQTHIDTDNNAAAWMLLSGLSQYVPMKNPEFVMTYWDNHHSTASDNILCFVLMVIEVINKSLKTQTANVIDKLAAVLLNSVRAPMVISHVVTTMSVLCQSDDDTDTTLEEMFKNYCKLIMKHCDKYLASVIFRKKSSSVDVNEDCMSHNLFTVGELGLHCPEYIPKRSLLILKSFLASPAVPGLQRTDFDELPDSQAIKSSQTDLFNGSRFGKPVRRIAFISLGKLCLQLQSLAKECVPAFGHELETSDDSIIRNNVVVIMADLCKRYTTMVDEYISAVTACLRDRSLIVRRQTLTLLTNLLQEDYLKWRGPLFFHYLSTLVDESAEIRSFGEYGLLHIMNKRHPTMFQQHFVECLFHFNGYKDHEKYNKIIQSEKEVQLFSMASATMRDKRSKLYKFMLENMDDGHRFQITTKVCQDVLGGIIDGSVKLSMANGATCASGHGLLQDALAVLSSDAIKLATLRSSPQDDLDDGDIAAAVVATAKKTMITQVVKKNAIENIVPIVVSLKHTLEKMCSPLLRDLMIYVKELMKDYKNEVKEILAADKQLATEIEYDLKKFEQEQREMADMRKREEREIGLHVSARDSNKNVVVEGGNINGHVGEVANNRASFAPVFNNGNSGESRICTVALSYPSGDCAKHSHSAPESETIPISGAVVVEKDKNETNTRVVQVSLERLNASSVSATNVCMRMPVIRLPRIDVIDPNEGTVRNLSETVKKLVLKEEQLSFDIDCEEKPAILQTPVQHAPTSQRNTLRAISTPHRPITNISFQTTDSMIIPSNSLSPIVHDESILELGSLPETVVHVNTPEESRQGTKKRWAIRPSNKRLSMQLEPIDEQ